MKFYSILLVILLFNSICAFAVTETKVAVILVDSVFTDTISPVKKDVFKAEKPNAKVNKMALISSIASLLGFVSIVGSLVGWLTIPGAALFSIAGLVLGIIGLVQLKKRKQKGKTLAILGITLAVLPFLLLLVVVIAFLTGGSFGA